MKTKFMTFAMMMAMLGITSCSKTDLYDEGKIAEMEAAEAAAAQEKIIAEYKANFVKAFGEVSPTQSWDFRSAYATFSYGESSNVRTRANESTPAAPIVYTKTPSSAYYELQNKTFQTLKRVFTESTNHESEGTYFAMKAPGNDFTIQPIFMGKSGGNFSLYLHVDGVEEDICIWNKWDGIQYKKQGDTEWTTLTRTSNGINNLLDAVAIQSKTITISGIPEGTQMHFYLKITEAANGYNVYNQCLTSVDGFLREYMCSANEVDLSLLPGIDKDTQVQCKMIGCEDASTSRTDKDFNDLVFLLYGQPDVPQSFDPKDLVKYNTKRYMIEDLGGTDDFDFNDIVVDVTQELTAHIKVDGNGNPLPGYENPQYTVSKTYAQIKAMGGTLDFKLKVGGKEWTKSSKFNPAEMINTQDPDYKKVYDTIDLPNTWNPDANDISVIVYKKNSTTEATQVNFPQDGEIPMMIATDANIKWYKERIRFPFEGYMNQ